MEKDLNYWKNNAEEDYMKVPISVLRYITELEKVVFPQVNVEKSACDRCEGKPESTDNILCDDCYTDLHGM